MYGRAPLLRPVHLLPPILGGVPADIDFSFFITYTFAPYSKKITLFFAERPVTRLNKIYCEGR